MQNFFNRGVSGIDRSIAPVHIRPMSRKTSLIITAVFFSAVLISSCGKQEPDTSAYAEVCSKVVKCDPQFSVLPDAQKSCQKFMAQLNERLPQAMDSVVGCLESTPCEELSFQKCGSENMQDLKGLINP